MKQLSEELLKEFSQGNPKAFEAVFDSFRARVFYFTKNIIGEQLIAEEITSDTFVKLYRLREHFSTFNNIQAFLFITARNACLDYLKHRQRQRQNLHELLNYQQQEIDWPLVAEASIEADVLQYIYGEIEKLPNRCKLIFKLFYLEGCSIRDIADLMNISAQTVSNQKNTALKILRMKVLEKTGLLLVLIYLLKEKH
jgi:RNA polymerase sigma-70 factor (family 1)